MRGEFIGVWSETWREIWSEIADNEAAPLDLFCELFRELAGGLKLPPSIEELADIIDNPDQSRKAFQNTLSDHLTGERAIVVFLENAYGVLDELAGDALSNQYFNLLSEFIDKFSLRYDLRRPCILCPTIPGMFASLVRDLRVVTGQDIHLSARMKEFEDSVRDLRYGCSDGRITTCIGKQFMLLEAMAAVCPGVTKKTLGEMSDQLGNWPHATIRESLKKLYGFASDYPGIRHGTSSKGAIRAIEMRDMVAICILLAGFTPYLIDQFNADLIYHGS
jgi:hypothetical protein